MANLKNINFMSQDTFESIEQVDDELYAVQFGFMPDYSAGVAVSFSPNTIWTAPSDGILILSASGGTNPAYYGLINETVMFKTSAGATSGGQGGLIILNKNDTVKMDTITVATQQNTFIPFKGVN